MRTKSLVQSVGLVLLGLVASGPAVSQERVAFKARDGAELTGFLFLPDKPGPRTAVVMMHGCGGVRDDKGRMRTRDREWAERFRDAGHVVLAPDSFGSRGSGSVCTSRDNPITPRLRAGDAAAAGEWLAARKDVDRSRMALIGWSHGGSTVLHAAWHSKPEGFDWRRIAAFYPGCRGFAAAGWTPRRPLAVLHGTADDWTPIEPCRDLMRGHSVTMIEYPGAHHGFDTPDSPLRRMPAAHSKDGSGIVTFGTDESARAKAIDQVMLMLAGMRKS
jgi:dienelactone hydrolase